MTNFFYGFSIKQLKSFSNSDIVQSANIEQTLKIGWLHKSLNNSTDFQSFGEYCTFEQYRNWQNFATVNLKIRLQRRQQNS